MMNEMDQIYGMHGREDRCILDLLGRPEKKRPLERPRHKGKDTIKLELEEVGLGGMDWIDLNQDGDSLWGVVNLVMKFQVP
jgi:hypothetical protein